MPETHERERTRAVFYRAWRAHREGRALEGVERLIVHVALRHPEYHAALDAPETTQARDYPTDAANPFLHLGLHIALEEQLALDQPRGIRDYYRALLRRHPDEHAVQHQMMDCLNETLARAQRDRSPPADADYLACLARLAGGPLPPTSGSGR